MLLDSTYKPEKGVQALGAQDPYPADTVLSLKPLTLFTSLAGRGVLRFRANGHHNHNKDTTLFDICE